MINNTLVSMSSLVMKMLLAILTQSTISPYPINKKIEAEIYYVGAKTKAVDIMALIEVESCFNPNAKKGKFIGVLQLGPSYMKESGYPMHYAETESGSIKAFLAVQKKYQKMLMGPPESIAIFHKGGPGTLRTYLSFLATGIDRHEALRRTSQIHKRVGNLEDFVKRWEAARKNKGWWCK